MRIHGVAVKEMLHVLRDPRSLFMAIGTPMIMLLLFGYALTLDVDHVPLVILDWSKSNTSRELISRFAGSRYFEIKSQGLASLAQIDQAINSGKAIIALVIPVDFEKQVGQGRSSAVQLIADGSDSNTATLSIGYAQSIVRKFSKEKRAELSSQLNQPFPKPPLDVRTRIWFNPQLESRINIVPNLIATIMMVISALLTSLTIAREWEQGTMEQLISTPVKKSELFIGKLCPYFLIGVIDLLFIILIGEFLFQVPLRGSLFLLFIAALIFLLGSLSLGLFISIIAKNQLVATQVAMVATFLPSFLLSGFITPINNMPYAIQLISYFVPARYFITILQGIYLKGTGLAALYHEFLFLICFCIIAISLSFLTFKKKLQ
jgi:ABC-2 type transport system permease protein